MEAVFVNNVPLRITPEDVVRYHLAVFPDLDDEENKHVLPEAIETVYTMFVGCETLFDMQPPQVWFDKTRLLFRLLACWYIANIYPQLVSGMPSMGAMPLKAKRIGPITITYQDRKGLVDDSLSLLDTNPFGIMAKGMIKNSGKRLRIGGNPARAGTRSWT